MEIWIPKNRIPIPLYYYQLLCWRHQSGLYMIVNLLEFMCIQVDLFNGIVLCFSPKSLTGVIEITADVRQPWIILSCAVVQLSADVKNKQDWLIRTKSNMYVTDEKLFTIHTIFVMIYKTITIIEEILEMWKWILTELSFYLLYSLSNNGII